MVDRQFNEQWLVDGLRRDTEFNETIVSCHSFFAQQPVQPTSLQFSAAGGLRFANITLTDFSVGTAPFRFDWVNHPPTVTFASDETTVTVANSQGSLAVHRPVASPWAYTPTGTTRWVATTGSDSNPGTSGSPFATIQHGINVSAAGDCVYVMPGTYVESLSFTTSGTAGHPIVVSVAPVGSGGGLGTVRIERPPADIVANPWRSCISLLSVSYVTVNGLLVPGIIGLPNWSNAGQCGISLSNGGDIGVRITNCATWSNTHCGIKEQGHGGSQFTIEGCVIFGNGLSPLDHGVYLASDGPKTLNGNVAFSNFAFQLHCFNSEHDAGHSTITKNLVFGGGEAGILVVGGGNAIQKNTVAYCGVVPAMDWFTGCHDSSADHNVFAFNAYVQDAFGGAADLATIVDDHNCIWAGIPFTYRGDHLDGFSGPTFGPNEVFEDPQFTNHVTGDFRTGNANVSTMGCYA